MLARFKKMDHLLIGTVLFLALFGTLMVYSASFVKGTMDYGSASFFFKRQMVSLLIGIILMGMAAFFPYKLYGKLTRFMILTSIVLLLAVLIFGVERNNSQRWLSLGPIMIQPTEIIKLMMIIYFASFYAKRQRWIHSFGKGVVPPLVILGMVFLLVLQQPDLGTASAILIPCGFILLCSGAKFKHILLLGGTAAAGVAYFAVSESYRMDRLLSFQNPFANPTGEGYQLVGSYRAIASGGLLGRGLGNSTEKLGFLPEAHTDFIMAIILEELGLLGLLVVIGAYMIIMYQGVQIAFKTDDMFGKLLAIGLTFQIMLQVIFNLGAVSGLLPITGIPLPFLSYGGSSLIIMLLSIGVLANISQYIKYKPFTRKESPSSN
ncbi:putative lipid II flippase FtsW [Halobacillus massiliensis]|uniref:putative lipid II flippase FtsW n=1 Tax=Halobacillus massiliensis TaxID=1926286 RepID=UPI0009E22E52|nr:putative lipid II flippase FtsW [Halobacillus massiliensis]